jgi:hypothetical protein
MAAALLRLESLPGEVEAVFPNAASLALLRPLAARAAKLTDPLSPAAVSLVREAQSVISRRYAHLSMEHKRLAGSPLEALTPEDAAVVGAAGALTAAVGHVLRSAWPILVRAVRAVGAWAKANPVKATALSLAAPAVPGILRGSKSAGDAVSATGAGLKKTAGMFGGLGGLALLAVAGLLLTRSRR